MAVQKLIMSILRAPRLFFHILILSAIGLGPGLPPALHAQELTTDSAFAGAPFDKWAAQGAREEVPWHVRMSADKLSFHQRLIANIQVEVPGPELLKRSHDDQIILLVQVRNGEGVSFRDFGLLELSNLKPASTISCAACSTWTRTGMIRCRACGAVWTLLSSGQPSATARTSCFIPTLRGVLICRLPRDGRYTWKFCWI